MNTVAQPASPAQADISTPAYFMKTFPGVGEAQANELSRQVQGGGPRGQGLAAHPPPAAQAPSVGPAPGAALEIAQAEWDRLHNDRRDGKISDYAWRETQARRDVLADRIANGAGNLPAPAAQAPPSDPMAEVFAPPSSASDYRLPHYEGTPTAEDIAHDRELTQAMFAAHLPKSMADSVLSDLLANSYRYANETAEQTQARLDVNRSRMTAMWAKEGITWQRAIDTIDREVASWPALLQEEFHEAAALLDPLQWDQILQIALHHNRAARR